MTTADATGIGITTLLRLTEEMLALASQGEWDAVSDYETQRQAVMQTLSPVGAVYLEPLKQLLDQNSQIVVLALTEKNRIAEELKSVRNAVGTELL